MLQALLGGREQVDAFVERAGGHPTALAQDDAVQAVGTAVSLPLGAAVENELIERGDGYAMQIACFAGAILKNSHGRYRNAYAAAREVAYGLSFLAPFALSELIEAAVRSDNLAAARDALESLSAHTLDSSDWAMGLTARCRALLSDGKEAERCYDEAVERLERTRLRPDLARVHLLYGEWLRREGRRLDAREHLQTAYDMLAAMGLDAFTDRARRELRATGEKVRKRQVGVANEHTPQEEHIARMASNGRTNAEIGAELFVSARTVEWHLRKVFTKLGIASRRELRDSLRAGSRA
jgi:DNA-binding CsgD family transcriptional regulator